VPRLQHVLTNSIALDPLHLLTEILASTVDSQLWTELEVEVKLRPTVSRPVCLGVRHPSGTRDQFFFLLEIFFRQSRVCYLEAPSLTRGRGCNLLLLLVLASAVPRDSRPYFLVPILETPSTGLPGSRIYILQEQGGPDKPPGTGFELNCCWPSIVRPQNVLHRKHRSSLSSRGYGSDLVKKTRSSSATAIT
jgi:hypothetical protein